MRSLASVVMVCAIPVLLAGACGGDGCGKAENPPQACRIEAAGGPECPSGKKCVYALGKEPQDPANYGMCATHEEGSRCSVLGPCLNPHKECGYNASICDQADGLTLCDCRGPHPKEESISAPAPG